MTDIKTVRRQIQDQAAGRTAQSRADSLMETLTNTSIGFAISYLTWLFLAWFYAIPMNTSTNLQIIGWFTIVSIARQYLLRRAFNGRSPWQALKGLFA